MNNRWKPLFFEGEFREKPSAIIGWKAFAPEEPFVDLGLAEVDSS